MRIGLNLVYLLPGVVGGTETYARGLLQGIARQMGEEEFVVFLNRESQDWDLPQGGKFERVVCGVRAVSRWRRYLFEQCVLPGIVKKHNVDLLHSLGYTGPLKPGCKSVVTIHDLNYIAFGQSLPVHRRIALSYFVRESARRSDCVIAVSDFSRMEIHKHLDIPLSKITSIHEAPHPFRAMPDDGVAHRVLRFHGVNAPYWVAFSSESPNKNIANLLRAMHILRKEHGCTQQLVLIGHRPKFTDRGLHMEGVVSTGYLPDDEVTALLSRAQLLVFPSTYEGFGLPVLEAMQTGVPVVCSRAASLPEIAGGAAVFFDPTDPSDIAGKVAMVAGNSEQQEVMREKGYANVKRFSWDKAAQHTLEVYRRVLHPGQ